LFTGQFNTKNLSIYMKTVTTDYKDNFLSLSSPFSRLSRSICLKTGYKDNF